VHSAYLLRLNQRASAHVVVEGGSENDRVEAVRVLHLTSRLSDAPFCAANGVRDHDRLVRALNHWLGHEDGPSPLECSGGTLYVDDPGSLSLLAQRLLIDHTERVEEGKVIGTPITGPARLAVGASRDLKRDVASGRLLPALHDTLDKLRIRLGGRRRGHAR
jgi:DNA-binding NtrC family response regulator